MRKPTSILAFRNGSIGNTVVAIPALRALRKRYPDAKLSVVVDSKGRELLEHCPWIDHLIVYEKRGDDRGLAAHLKLVRKLRSLRPSHAVLFKRFFRNGLLAYLSGARARAGFMTGGRAPFLNLTTPYDETVNILDLNLRLASLLEAQSADRSLELYLSEEDRRASRNISGSQPYIVAHYGGLTTAPEYFPTDEFASLLNSVAGDDFQILLIGSGSTETNSARSLTARMKSGKSVTGLPLRVTAALIESSALFVGFNSGPAHLAAATGTPGVVFFRREANTERELLKWAPASTRLSVMVPPESSSEDEWRRFLLEATEILSHCRALKRVAVSD